MHRHAENEASGDLNATAKDDKISGDYGLYLWCSRQAMIEGIALARLFLRLQSGFGLTIKRLNPGRTGKKEEPLLFVERDGETPHSIEGEGVHSAHLEAQPAGFFLLELGILSPRTFPFSFHLQFVHAVSPNWPFISTAIPQAGFGRLKYAAIPAWNLAGRVCFCFSS